MFKLKSESDEMLALDLLRFVAACGVVTLHYGGEYLKQIGLVSAAARLEFLNLAVDVFFVISGFVIAYVYSKRIATWADYGRFLWRRVTRLLPLHWATLAFFVVAGLGMAAVGIQSSAPETFAWGDLIEATFLLHLFGGVSGPAFNYPVWSISAEMAMYLAFPIFLIIGRWRMGLPVLVLTVISWLAVRDLGYFAPKSLLEPDGLRALAAFPLGMILYAVVRSPRRIGGVWFLLSGAAATALSVLGWLHVQAIWLLPLAYGCASLAAISDVSRFRPRWLQTVAPLGGLTYSIYMLHVPVKAGMSYTATLLGSSFEGSLFWLAVTIAVLGAASWLSYFLFETPLRNVLNAWVSRRRPPMRAKEETASHLSVTGC